MNTNWKFFFFFLERHTKGEREREGETGGDKKREAMMVREEEVEIRETQKKKIKNRYFKVFFKPSSLSISLSLSSLSPFIFFSFHLRKCTRKTTTMTTTTNTTCRKSNFLSC